MASNVLIEVDISELKPVMDHMKNVMGPAKFEQFMYRTMSEVGRKVKTIVKKDVQHDYEVTQSWVGSQIGRPRISMGGAGVQCLVPVKGHRGSVGGTYKAMAFKKGAKVRGRVRAKIVKGGTSTMPQHMSHQGGNPPFMANGIAFTRKTKKPYPIASVVGLGVPQMPMNRSQDEVQRDIVRYAEERLVHNFNFMMGRG